VPGRAEYEDHDQVRPGPGSSAAETTQAGDGGREATASVARLARSGTKYDPDMAAALHGRPRREIAAKMAAASVARLVRSWTKYRQKVIGAHHACR
jgi:hypothetical protein